MRTPLKLPLRCATNRRIGRSRGEPRSFHSAALAASGGMARIGLSFCDGDPAILDGGAELAVDATVPHAAIKSGARMPSCLLMGRQPSARRRHFHFALAICEGADRIKYAGASGVAARTCCGGNARFSAEAPSCRKNHAVAVRFPTKIAKDFPSGALSCGELRQVTNLIREWEIRE